MDKQALKSRMLELEESELAQAREHYVEHIAEARLDRTEAHEVDDVSRAEAEGELAEAFDQPIHAHTEKLAYLRTMDFAPRDDIGEGAVVRLDGRWLVVAVSTTRFEFGDQTLMGISTAAPVYKAMEGLRAGDSFRLNGRDVSVDEVL